MLPKNFDNGALSKKDMDDFVDLEKSLLETSIPVPVYFAFHDDNIARMVRRFTQEFSWMLCTLLTKIIGFSPDLCKRSKLLWV